MYMFQLDYILLIAKNRDKISKFHLILLMVGNMNSWTEVAIDLIYPRMKVQT